MGADPAGPVIPVRRSRAHTSPLDQRADQADVDAWGPTQRVTESATSPSTPRPASARTAGGRDVRAVRLIATRRVPARATAFGTAPAPRAPRAQADAHPHRTLATRAEPKPPPPGRPQSASGAPCGARPHPSSPAQPSPLRRRVRLRRLTTPATRGYPQQQTRALRSLPVEGPARRSSRGAPAVDAPASAPRQPAAIAYVVRPAGAWSCSRRSRRASWWRRSCRVGRAATGAWEGCARGRSLSAERASRSISSGYAPTSPRYANGPEPTETPGNEYRHPLGSGCPGALSAGPVLQPLGGAP
jgi:hypothetical protein